MALLCGALLIAGCSQPYGFGIADLPAERGWQPLPIGDWVLNDGISAKAMSFCPRATCAQQGFAALITLSGQEADAAERILADDPARLARDFARPSADEKPSADDKREPGRQRSVQKPKSITTVSRFTDSDAKGLLVEIRARNEAARRAFTAILSGRTGPDLTIALGVSADAEAARSQALAAWRGR